MIALKLLDNGITVIANQPRRYYIDNQLHELNGKDYWVVLSNRELQDRIDWHLDQIPVTTFITNMAYLFGERNHRWPREDLQLPTWDTSDVRDMSRMFHGCKNFDDDISNWDLSNVQYIGYMFAGCTNFNRDLSNWEVGDNWWITDVEHEYRVDLYNDVNGEGEMDYDNLYMFRGCDLLKYQHSWSKRYPNNYIYAGSPLEEEVLTQSEFESF